MLIACDRCRRHFSIRETSCPFCRHGGTLARVGAVALSAGVLLSGCDAGDKKQPPPAVEKKPYGTVHGSVQTSAAKPIPNTILTITSTDDPSAGRSYSRTVPTDASGRYTFEFLPPGGYTLGVAYNRSQGMMEVGGDVQREIVVLAGDDKAIDFTVDLRSVEVAPPYGAPPARRRVV